MAFGINSFKNVNDNVSRGLGKKSQFNRAQKTWSTGEEKGEVSFYNTDSLWSRWRRGYELYSAIQTYFGSTASEREKRGDYRVYFSFQQFPGVFIPARIFTFPSSNQELGEQLVGMRDADSFSFYDKGLPKQDSVQQMMARGMLGKKDQRMNMPFGLTGILSKLPDNYYDKMTLGDQILTQSYMGFTDPNTNMANKDPFGINVRSAFGNYSQYADKQVDKLGDMLSGRLAEKYGATWDEELGAYTGANAKKANDMTKMLREKYGFYGNVKKKKQDITADLGLIQKAIEAEKKQKHDAAVKNLKTANLGITSATSGGSTARERGAAAAAMGGGSRQAKSGGQKAGGSGRTDGGWGWAKGGIVELLK